MQSPPLQSHLIAKRLRNFQIDGRGNNECVSAAACTLDWKTMCLERSLVWIKDKGETQDSKVVFAANVTILEQKVLFFEKGLR